MRVNIDIENSSSIVATIARNITLLELADLFKKVDHNQLLDHFADENGRSRFILEPVGREYEESICDDSLYVDLTVPAITLADFARRPAKRRPRSA